MNAWKLVAVVLLLMASVALADFPGYLVGTAAVWSPPALPVCHLIKSPPVPPAIVIQPPATTWHASIRKEVYVLGENAYLLEEALRWSRRHRGIQRLISLSESGASGGGPPGGRWNPEWESKSLLETFHLE